MNKKLISIIKKLTGSLVCYGITDEKIADAIDNNDNIYDCDLLNSDYSSGGDGKNNNIMIKSIKKRYRKNKVDYMIINLDEVDSYIRKVVVDSTYVAKKNIYIYGTNNDNVLDIVDKYKRYNLKIIKNDYKDGYIVSIDITDLHSNKLKDFIYYFNDTLIYIIDKIGDIIS